MEHELRIQSNLVGQRVRLAHHSRSSYDGVIRGIFTVGDCDLIKALVEKTNNGRITEEFIGDLTCIYNKFPSND